MQRVNLPGSDLNVSPICLGTWQFNGGQVGGDKTWGAMSVEESKKIWDKALETGINFIDTAEAYLNSHSVLGQIMDPSKRRDIVLASKVGNGKGANSAPYTAEDIDQAVTTSLEKLKTDYIDLYQVHWPTIMADVNETVAELKRQQAKGRIRYYGVCNFGPNDLRGFLEAGGQPISNQVCYNLLWRSIEEELLPLCQEKGISLLPYSPLQQGLLTGKFQMPSDVPEGRRRGKLFHKDSTPLARHGHDGAEKEVFQAISEIREVCAKANIPMATASLSWLLQQPCVKSVIVGASNPQQVVENCQRVTLPEDVVQKFSAATDPVKVIFKGDMDQWAYGRSS
ncbi:uncharacterized protein LOC106156969 [Lingula anatina]|uniref:Uncharacterized protein LOC106156969 n=1 Tax=Lingula anatina TaxID=7574 RepID=A0A1S3HS37_LINAN|nr:uncharacterized protein LOC106156969 [Lingula anatina]|eukprot:XP_013387869.1 uncharacterized protein LOC106156969 [Lingula anatina]